MGCPRHSALQALSPVNVTIRHPSTSHAAQLSLYLFLGKERRSRRAGVHIRVRVPKHTLDHRLVFAPRELFFENKRKPSELRVQLRDIILALSLCWCRLHQSRTDVDFPSYLRKYLAKTRQQSRPFGCHLEDLPNFQVLRAVHAIWPRRAPSV